MADLNDELNKAAKEFKEIVGNLKSSEKTKDAVQELQEIKEQIEKSSSSNLKEIKQFKEETKERITKSAVYDEEATNRSIFSAKSLFSCSGRLGKIGYGVINVLLYILLVSIMYGLFRLERYTRAYTIVDMLILITYAGFCTLYIIALIRRLHDCGKNGVPTLLAIPLLVMCHSYGYDWHMAPFYIGIVVALIMFIQPGTDDDNAYGPVPPVFDFGATVKNGLETIRGKIEVALSVVGAFLKDYAIKIALGISFITVLSCIGIYLYIPKISDVEDYKANYEINKLINLIDKTSEWQMFLNVRTEAIKALIILKDPKGDEYIDGIIHKKYDEYGLGNNELRDEFLRCGISVDKKFAVRRIDRYHAEIENIKGLNQFGDEREDVYNKMQNLALLLNDSSIKSYVASIIASDYIKIIKNDKHNYLVAIGYLREHIDKYGNVLPNPDIAKAYNDAMEMYDDANINIGNFIGEISYLEDQKRDILRRMGKYNYKDSNISMNNERIKHIENKIAFYSKRLDEERKNYKESYQKVKLSFEALEQSLR